MRRISRDAVAKKVRAILPLHPVDANEPEIRLVHEPDRIDRVMRPLAPQPDTGERAQLVVDGGHQAVQRLAVAVARRDEQGGDVAGSGHDPGRDHNSIRAARATAPRPPVHSSS
jgi:hypothetical protein